MAAAVHMDSTRSSASVSPPPPWHPPAPVPVPTHQPAALFEPHLVAASPPPAAARSASRRRRPRPSRKLPTTYIRADPASFRRMVHEVTGAHDLLLPRDAATLCRPAPSRAAAAAALTLPTLDTSAFLLGSRDGSAGGALEPVGGGGAGAGAAAGGAYGGGGTDGGDGFPTLESWDALLY